MAADEPPDFLTEYIQSTLTKYLLVADSVAICSEQLSILATNNHSPDHPMRLSRIATHLRNLEESLRRTVETDLKLLDLLKKVTDQEKGIST
ncbi:MAG: hypothetical protein OXG05_08330 [Gammaproteobacteria bacterium]|nr:hypothetical protein [Gammaproteobacteria bacterium]